MGSPDSVLERRALPDQDEVPVGKVLELGSRYGNDEYDCSCRTDCLLPVRSIKVCILGNIEFHPLILGKGGNSVDETCLHVELLLGFL
jgi:hypothetical protein